MACRYFNNCEYCSLYVPDNPDDMKCDIFGLPIGDGSPYCKYFACNADECKSTECISYEEELAMKQGY